METDHNQEIEDLKSRLEQLRSQFHLLLAQEDPPSIKYLKEIDRATEERNKDIIKYKENESKIAQIYKDGMDYQLHDEKEQAMIEMSDRFNGFFKFKCTQISKVFPHAFAYFKKQNCPFSEAILSESEFEQNLCDGYQVELSSSPLISGEELEKLLQLNNEDPNNYYVKETTLYCGSKQFGIGSAVILCYNAGKNNLLNINCKISDINSRYIEFTTENGKSKRIRLDALKYKVCTLQKP